MLSFEQIIINHIFYSKTRWNSFPWQWCLLQVLDNVGHTPGPLDRLLPASWQTQARMGCLLSPFALLSCWCPLVIWSCLGSLSQCSQSCSAVTICLVKKEATSKTASLHTRPPRSDLTSCWCAGSLMAIVMCYICCHLYLLLHFHCSPLRHFHPLPWSPAGSLDQHYVHSQLWRHSINLSRTEVCPALFQEYFQLCNIAYHLTPLG